MKTRFQNILATCVPPRNTRLDRMSMAVEKAERKARQRLSIAAEIFRSWEISKKIYMGNWRSTGGFGAVI